MVEITADRWASLREQRPFNEAVYELISEDCATALIGVAGDGRLELLVEVDAAPVKLPPDLQSIKVRVVEAAQIWICISAGSHHEALFTLVATRICEAIQIECRDPAMAVDTVIKAMRSALQPLTPDLSPSVQTGLFGELWTLSNVLFPTFGAGICHLWSGPENERHDFVGNAAHIEVKTTTGSEPRHEISRLDQLRAPAGKHLLLVSIMLERSIAGATTLADLIDEIREKLGNDGHAIDVFDAKLARLKWSEGLRQNGSLIQYVFREVHVFHVAGSFPRLPDDYRAPPGVSAIKYAIDVSTQPSLTVAEVETMLQTFTPAVPSHEKW